MREIEIYRPVLSDLLLERDIGGINARVLVITAENANATKTRNRIGERARHRKVMYRRTRARGRRYQTRPRRSNKRIGKQAAGDRLLLHAIRCYRADLRQHVLACAIDAIACPKDALLIICDVPRESDSWLPHLLIARQRSVRRESRVA